MFIKTNQLTRSFPYTRNNKQFKKKRTTNIAHLRCDNCGKEFTRQIGKDIDKKRCTNDVKHFCSACPSYALAAKIGQQVQRDNRKKNIGQRMFTVDGYVRVYVQDTHPHSDGYCGSVFEHTMVMENYLNRSLEKGEVVHHIDGDKANNDITNLDVMSIQEHNKCHGSGANELLFELYKNGAIIYNRETKKYESI